MNNVSHTQDEVGKRGKRAKISKQKMGGFITVRSWSQARSYCLIFRDDSSLNNSKKCHVILSLPSGSHQAS